MTRPHASRPLSFPEASAAAREHDLASYELATYDLLGLSTSSAVNATLVREARRSAGVSTAELGRRAGVPEQVVALWEDPTWEGHSLNVLRRVAKALDLRLELRLVPARSRAEVAAADEYVAA